jgi:hypothetical protein
MSARLREMSMQQAHAAARRAHRPVERESAVYELRDEFEPSIESADRAGAMAAAAVSGWGIARAAERAKRAAVVQVAWLANHEQPGGKLGFHLRYEPVRRELGMCVRDAGTLLPAQHLDNRLCSDMRSVAARSGAEYLWPTGRELWCVIKVRAPWRIRLAWSAPASGHHPRFTYEPCESEELARRAAAWALGCAHGDSQDVHVVEVHIQGPTDPDAVWSEFDAESVAGG